MFNDENSRERLKYVQMAQLAQTIPWATPNQVLSMMGLPPLEERKVRFDSVTGDIDFKTEEMGDIPIFQIQQQLGIGQFAPKDNTNPNAANPQKNQDKKENAERLNSEQANETRANKFSKSNPTKDYPFGAVEPEREVTNDNMFRDFKARIRAVLEARDRAAANVNMDFDKPGVPKVVLPNVTGYETKSGKETGDKAVFYEGTDQLAEMGIRPKTKL
jgi:hypothetical protein